MLHAFVFSQVSVNVRRWFEIGLDDGVMEHGARVELRLLEPQAHRGTESAAQRIAIDGAFWRADLFDRLDRPAGGFTAAHFHPRFDGIEPSERHWADALRDEPWEWLHIQLSDIGQLAEAAGIGRARVLADVEDVRSFTAEIVATAQKFSPERQLDRDDDFRLTRDVAGMVMLMIDNLKDPDLLDRDHVAPWCAAAQELADHR